MVVTCTLPFREVGLCGRGRQGPVLEILQDTHLSSVLHFALREMGATEDWGAAHPPVRTTLSKEPLTVCREK